MALEITNLRVTAADRDGRAPGPEASILKIKGTEIQQALTELMMEAVGPYALPYLPAAWGDHWLGERVGPEYAAPLASRYFNYRKISIYGGSNEIQRNIIAQHILGLVTRTTHRKGRARTPRGAAQESASLVFLAPWRLVGATQMDFDYTEEQQLLKDSIEKFLAKNYSFEQRRAIIESREGMSPTAWEGFASMGLLGVPIPEEFGGFGGGGVDTMIVMEAFGRALVVEPYLSTVVLAGSTISLGGSDAQRQILLPRIVDGSMKFAFAHTEPGTRFELNRVETTARQAGGMWVINGASRSSCTVPSPIC